MTERPTSPSVEKAARTQLFTLGNEQVNKNTPGVGSFPSAPHAGHSRPAGSVGSGVSA
jgi:hypothetical protein